MHAHVVLRDHDGREHELSPGELIGRSWSAALQIDDGRVSEAHAMVSLREGELQLIPLRGAIAVAGEPKPQVTLKTGLVVQLAPGVELEVVAVTMPDHVLAVEGEGFGRQILPPVGTLVVESDGPRLVAGWREDGALHLWSTGGEWVRRVPGGVAEPLFPGETLQIGRWRLQAVAVELAAAGRPATLRMGGLDAPLVVVAHYDTVHVHRAGGRPTVFNGRQARLISELVAAGTPLSWGGLSEQIWSDEDDPNVRRSRLDVLLSRIRRTLRAHGIRSDLVRTDGAGMVELFLYGGDRVEDHT